MAITLDRRYNYNCNDSTRDRSALNDCHHAVIEVCILVEGRKRTRWPKLQSERPSRGEGFPPSPAPPHRTHRIFFLLFLLPFALHIASTTAKCTRLSFMGINSIPHDSAVECAVSLLGRPIFFLLPPLSRLQFRDYRLAIANRERWMPLLKFPAGDEARRRERAEINVSPCHVSRCQRQMYVSMVGSPSCMRLSHCIDDEEFSSPRDPLTRIAIDRERNSYVAWADRPSSLNRVSRELFCPSVRTQRGGRGGYTLRAIAFERET